MREKRGFMDRGNSKGQVTVFIIIGIIILFVFAGVLYVTQTSTGEQFLAEAEPVIVEVPTAFKPLQEFTDSCLTQIGRRGLIILGEQGGYIYPDLVGQYSSYDPTDSDGIDLGGSKVPYWHYNTPLNTGDKIAFGSRQPKLYARDDPEMSIESQLARYVEERVDECLNNYRDFTSHGFNVESSSKEVVVRVGENSVNFLLNMDVRAEQGGAVHDLDQFYVKIPLRLKHYYEVASEIAGVEKNYSFLERQALDLLVIYSGVDSKKLPPMEAVRFDLVPVARWNEFEVKEKVKGLLVSNVPMLRYLGSTNFYRYDFLSGNEPVTDLSELHQKNYDNTILPLELAQNLEVNFDYFGWELYFDTNSKGGSIEPSHYTAGISFLQFNTQHYYTSYDISYPVLATLRDSDALDGRGYNFVFALESNIRNTKLVEDEETLPPPVAALSRSMVCDEDKRNTEPLKTIVLDSSSMQPLEMVQVGFTVPEQDTCIMGVTDEEGELESKYPAVYGGVTSYVKLGYLTNFYPVDTYQYKKEPGIIGYAAVSGIPERVVTLHPYKLINVAVMRKDLEKCIDNDCPSQGLFSSAGDSIYSYEPALLDSEHSWIFSGSTKKLSETETATVVLKRVGDTDEGVAGDDFVAAVTVKGSKPAELELVPGMYEMTVLVKDVREPGKEIIIPAEERCTGGILESVACWNVDGCCFQMEENKMDELISGQVMWKNETNYLTITPDNLYGSDKITIYTLGFNLEGVPQMAHQRVIEDLMVMSQLGNFSTLPEIKGALEPTYS